MRVTPQVRERQCRKVDRLFHRMLADWVEASVVYAYAVPGTARGFWVYSLPVFEGSRINRMWLGETFPGALAMARGIRFRFLRDERLEVLDRVAGMIPYVTRAIEAIAD